MEKLGWIGSERPKMVVVQSEGCAPIVKAWNEGSTTAEFWEHASTVAAGLRVPKAYGDYLILDILARSSGAAVTASDGEILDAVRHWASTEGIFAGPEGATALVAYQKLLGNGFFAPDDNVVLFNTGSGLKYLDVIQPHRENAPAPAARHIGGIIGPY
jgi:threonine synthase